MSSTVLYLASSSQSRQMLLTQARIPFECIKQVADERLCNWSLPLSDVVYSIALYKMDHIVMSPGKHEGEKRYVITADTLCETLSSDGVTWCIEGKPSDREDARRKIRAARRGARLCTAFCLDVKTWRAQSWHMYDRIADVVSADYIFDVPDEWIDRYLDNSWGLQASNGIAVEEYGMQFLKNLSGSYSAIIGLPLYEVRCALESLEFFFNK